MASLVDQILALQKGDKVPHTDYGAFLRGYRNRQNDRHNWTAASLNEEAARIRNTFNRNTNPLRTESLWLDNRQKRYMNPMLLEQQRLSNAYNRSMNPIRVGTAAHQLRTARQLDPLVSGSCGEL